MCPRRGNYRPHLDSVQEIAGDLIGREPRLVRSIKDTRIGAAVRAMVERRQQSALDVVCVGASLQAADEPLRVRRDVTLSLRSCGIPADDVVGQQCQRITIPVCFRAGALCCLLQWTHGLPECRCHTLDLDVLLRLIVREMPQDVIALNTVPHRLDRQKVGEDRLPTEVDVDRQVTDSSLPEASRLQDIEEVTTTWADPV